MRASFLLQFGHLLTLAATVAGAESESMDFGLVDWITSVEGGYFNPKQEIRRENPDDPNSLLGVFAKEKIEKGELLSQVPWTAIIDDRDYEPEDEEMEENTQLACGTVRNLAEEMRLGKDSDFAPYVLYLLNQPRGQIPSGWSPAGQALLRRLLGGTDEYYQMPPQYAFTWLEVDWYTYCGGDRDDPLLAHAALMVIQRGDDEVMVPIYDLYNHRNGVYHNSEIEVEKGVTHKLLASRTIEAGEQIHNSYNLCSACGGRWDGYGTPDIFRDYGFVESFPQRFFISDPSPGLQWDLNEDELTGEIKVVWDEETNPSQLPQKTLQKWITFFKNEILRAHRIRNYALWHKDDLNVPDNEWDTIWQYQEAVVLAYSLAVNDLVKSDAEKVPVPDRNGQKCTADSPCANPYDSFDTEVDDFKYLEATCDNQDILLFEDYEITDEIETQYQNINFNRHEDDVCMDLDNTLQICSCYRPQYHEFPTHYAARFLDTVRRVVFIGGGDSMLLHEVLKYPTLEKVVGLELDQTVVRKSFQRFDTQPHFDDPRVEWWFGDATKSLLLLPDDYWGSFDLVLIDLSETVMAITVTDGLEVFDALALLLKPEGILVKNELYFGEMSETFDYSVQISYESPKLCRQVMAFGSNFVDFFRDPLKDHGVKSLFLPDIEDMKRFDFMHDYRKNDATAQGKCSITDAETDKPTVQTRSAGILMVVDAEDTSITSRKELEEAVTLAVAKHGFNPIGDSLSNDEVYIVLLKEGYVSARYVDSTYSAFDIWLWGSLNEQAKLRDTLTQAIGSKITSSFRVVVGGMFGSTTWEQDSKVMGPKSVQRRNCEPKECAAIDESASKPLLPTAGVVAKEVATTLFTEISDSSTPSSEIPLVVVVCGNETEGPSACTSLTGIQALDKHVAAVTIWTCPDILTATDPDSKLAATYNCEKGMEKMLLDAMAQQRSKISMIIFDETAPIEMGQIFNSIWSVFDLDWLDYHHVFLTFNSVDKSDSQAVPWHRNFLDRHRKLRHLDPVAKVEVALQPRSGGPMEDTIEKEMEIGILSDGDHSLFEKLSKLESSLETLLPAWFAEVRYIRGANYPFVEDYDPQEFGQSDYDSIPAKQQRAEQKVLGHETVFQYQTAETAPSITVLKDGLEKSIASLSTKSHTSVVDGVGDGALILSNFAGGTASVVWDGRSHVDLTVYLSKGTKAMMDNIKSKFESLMGQGLTLSLRDDFPRGTGRVMEYEEL